MGLLINGQWQDSWYDTKSCGGKFERSLSQFNNWITSDSAPGASAQDGFKAEANRYHLYVSLACPWAHRTLIFRQLKGLQNIIGVTVVDPHMLENGWELNGERDSDQDEINAHDYLYQLYLQAQPDYQGRVTVPVLWDKKRKTIVSTESADIIRMFNSAFDGLTNNTADYYPKTLRKAIDKMNATVYQNINNGVYRCGFATAQESYEEAYEQLFTALGQLEILLDNQRYLLGHQLTEADWRLFTTLVRFDAVYVGHFKCNQKRIADYPNLSNYLRDLYQVTGIKQTVNMTHIKQHYYYSHTTINPTRVVPKGPVLNFDEAHNRNRFAEENKYD
ncbi:MAG: glutathione S-transferase family protein [Xanthomonadales bacterium]|nr:glutathione S-transferase family protein [Xanthomonadales bacterium]